MSKITCEWRYLERRPVSSHQQVSSKASASAAWTLYCEHVNRSDARNAEELAADCGIRLEAVHEAIACCQGNPSELLEDHRKDEVLAEAISMNYPPIRHSDRPRCVPTDERERLEL